MENLKNQKKATKMIQVSPRAPHQVAKAPSIKKKKIKKRSSLRGVMSMAAIAILIT